MFFPVFFAFLSNIQQQTTRAITIATGTVAAGQQRPRAPITPAGTKPSSGLVLLLLPPAPSQAGRDCSAFIWCVVLALVAVRFPSWTMMAELCFSVDDFIRAKRVSN